MAAETRQASFGDDLLRRAQGGDPSAWRELYAQELPAVWRYACALSGNHSEAEEITSETMLALVRNLQQLDSQECRLALWLRGVVRHKASDLIRRAGRHRAMLRQASLDPRRQPSTNGPALSIESEELEQRILRILDRLEDHERQALEWKYIENLSVREIAERNGQSVKSAESILYRARKEFRRLYDLAERRDAQPAKFEPPTTK